MKTDRARPLHDDDPPLKPIIEGPDYVPPGMEGLERIAWLMDRAFRIPGTPIRVGLDSLIGLLPVGGDVVTGIIQIGIVLVAMAHYKVPRVVAARMAANVLLDVGVGAIPLVGDVFDVFFKANTRNLALLREVQEHHRKGLPVPAAPSMRYLLTIGALLGGALVIVLALFIAAVVWLARHLTFTP